jgi:hypothetical protein
MVTLTLTQEHTAAVAGMPVRLAFTPLELVPIGAEPRFQGVVAPYIVRIDRLAVQQPGEWVATLVIRRGLEF